MGGKPFLAIRTRVDSRKHGSGTVWSPKNALRGLKGNCVRLTHVQKLGEKSLEGGIKKTTTERERQWFPKLFFVVRRVDVGGARWGHPKKTKHCKPCPYDPGNAPYSTFPARSPRVPWFRDFPACSRNFLSRAVPETTCMLLAACSRNYPVRFRRFPARSKIALCARKVAARSRSFPVRSRNFPARSQNVPMRSRVSLYAPELRRLLPEFCCVVPEGPRMILKGPRAIPKGPV